MDENKGTPSSAHKEMQLSMFGDIPFTFGERFLADHAGQIIAEPRIAIVEIVANAYDAGATEVKVTWPERDGEWFEVADNGTGMTPDEFARRWKQFNYNRRLEQGEDVEFPKGVRAPGKRKAFGQSGKGRHGAFCFGDEYFIKTCKGETSLRVGVKWLREADRPFDFAPEPAVSCKPSEHGTTVTGKVIRNRMAVASVQDAIASKFLVDPSFRIVINDSVIDLVDIKHLTESTDVTAETGDVVTVHRIDAPAEDRTTKLRGITWWVNGKMVGQPSWEGLDKEGAILDGRTRAAKRHSFVVVADCLRDYRKSDWEAFHDSKEVLAVKKAVRAHVIEQVAAILSETRKERKISALSEQREVLQQLPRISQEAVGHFIDEVQQKCPSLSDAELSKTVEVFTRLEQARSGYELLHKLAACSPADLDTWNNLMEEWTADRAAMVLAELKRRLDLIDELQRKVDDKTTDELHDLQPLFAEGLWIFGPEYESADFIGNRQMATVLAKLIGTVPEHELSARRPDFVVLPDRSLGVYAADDHDTNGEVMGFRKILVLELKRGSLTLSNEEMRQGTRYAEELQDATGVLSATKFVVFVLGGQIANAREMTIGDTIVARPCCYGGVLRSAHARTFNLQRKLAAAQPRRSVDKELDDVVATAQQVMFS